MHFPRSSGMTSSGQRTGVHMKVQMKWTAVFCLFAVNIAGMAWGSVGCAAPSSPPSVLVEPGAVTYAWDHYDLYVASWGYGFQGPTMAGSVDHGVIPAGEDLRIFYRKSARDLGLKSEISGIELQWRIEDQEFQTVRMDPAHPEASIHLPESARGELQIWFKLDLADGTSSYDSLYGANYRASIVGVDLAVVSFSGPAAGSSWPEPVVDGNLTPYSRVRVRYDFSRMTALGAPTNSSSFHVEGFVSALDTQSRVIEKDEFRVERNPSRSGYFNVPRNTERLELYFVGTAGTRSWYDSNLGRNFSFKVQ